VAPGDIYDSVMGETLMTLFSCHSSGRDYSFQVTSPINHTMYSFHSSRRDYMFWTDTSGDRIYRSRLDASQRTTLISFGLSSAGINRIQHDPIL